MLIKKTINKKIIQFGFLEKDLKINYFLEFSDLDFLETYDIKFEELQYKKYRKGIEIRILHNIQEKLLLLGERNNESLCEGMTINIARCLIYKMIGKHFEQDTNLMRAIYNLLWNNYSVLKDENRHIYKMADVMNSFKTTFNEYDKTKNKCNYIKKLDNFASLTHSIGNFVLVPKGFNVWRNRTFKDYWDLSLNYLKTWTKEEKKQPKNFNWEKGNFNKYINYFFLWDYVYADDNEYKVKSLYKEEFKKGENFIFDFNSYNGLRETKALLPTQEEIPIFINNVNYAIKRRGIFMVAMLKLATENEKLYKSIQNEVFATEKIYNGYNDVFEKILENAFGYHVTKERLDTELKNTKYSTEVKLLLNTWKTIDEVQKEYTNDSQLTK